MFNVALVSLWFIITVGVKLVESVVPSNVPLMGNEFTREELIRLYFLEGFKYCEIILFLYSRHNIVLSVRQLGRILRRLGLQRRQHQYSPQQAIIDAIRQECSMSGRCIGYRTMWRRLLQDHGLLVRRNDVMETMQQLYPKATAERRAHRLQRRKYANTGPNFVWHADGYDKLKPFGFCIHGCIDGYSRRIMWLEVASSNNNPAVIAKYYLDCIQHVQCAPRLLRVDRGTENKSLSFLQPLFRFHSNDSLAGVKSFMYGKSTSNQRIETWWGVLRKLGIHWWINLFKDIRDTGMFDLDNPVVKECLRFCFMDALQTDLDRIASHWNSHVIRPQRGYGELPSGKPDVLYFVPELTDGQDFKTPVNVEDVNVCINMYGKKKETCSGEFKELVYLIKPDVQIPVHPDEALELFIELNDALKDYV